MTTINGSRGFSLLTVLLILIVVAVMGTMSLNLSTGQESISASRTTQRQALAAAEAGLGHFFGTAPAMVEPNMYYVGSAGSDATSFVYLPDTMGRDGASLEARYRVYSTAAGPVADSVRLISEGQVVSGNKVVGRSIVEAIVSATAGTATGSYGQGQKSMGPWGTSSNMPARTDISLIFN